MKSFLRAIWISIICLLICSSSIQAADSAPDSDTIQQLSHGWQYHWDGDSEWKNLNSIGSVPDRQGRKFLWMRIQLSQSVSYEPTLYIGEIEQAYEVFLDGSKIYQFGDLSGQTNFKGYGLNLIPLGPNYAGKTLTLHIYSDYSQIGIFGSVKLDSRNKLILDLIHQDMVRILFAILYVFFGLLFALLFIKDWREPAYIYFCFFLFLMGIWITSRTDAKFFFFNHPEFWTACRIYSINAVPVFFLLFYERLLGKGYRNISRRFWQIHLLFAIGVLIAVNIGHVPIMKTLVPFDLLLLASIVYTITFGFIKWFQGNNDAKIFSLGVIIFAATSAYDILNTLGFAPWIKPISYLGLFIFVVSMAFILGRQFIKYGILGAKLDFQKEKLAQTMRAMSSGTAIINHAIKNEIIKINYLAGKSKNAIAAHNLPDADRSIDAIFSAVGYLKEMVDKIRERTADIELNLELCDIQEMIEQTATLIKPLLSHKQVSLVVDCKDPLWLKCDPVFLRDCFVNICINAIEAMEALSGKLQIRVTSSKREAVIEFRDNGSGIPEDQIARVTEPFFSTKKSKDNYGLGLSYCYGIIQQHEGTLHIRSKLRTGTIVTIRMPI